MNISDFKHYIFILKEADKKGVILKYPLNRFFNSKHFLEKEVILKNKYGKWFCGNSMENCLVACSSFEPNILREMIKTKNGTFVDIGAHIGKYSIIMGKHLNENGKVISIEADKNTVLFLKKNIALNNLKNVEVHNFACSNKSGKIFFYLSNSNPATNSLISSSNKVQKELESRTLDSLNLKNVSFIKIDVEGAEDLVIEGGKKTISRSNPKIIFEALTENDLTKVRNLLLKMGYDIKKICEHNYLAKYVE